MNMRLYLYDDDIARTWLPFVSTRPAGELSFGCETQRGRTARVTGLPVEAHLAPPFLTGFSEAGAPPVSDLAALPLDTPRLLLSSRLVLEKLPDFNTGKPAFFTLGEKPGVVIGTFAPPGHTLPTLWTTETSAPPETQVAPGVTQLAIEGILLSSTWDLMAKNGDRITADSSRFNISSVPPGAQAFGDHSLHLADGVIVEPGVVFDLTTGPIILDERVRVQAFTRMAGPVYVGPGSTILGGSLSEVSIGPVCKIRGEVESTVILGYSNKAHDGFLGHAVVGRWVNLGAMTTNSDLKNNYGPVRIQIREQTIDTGQMKIGSLLGDHVRTGIGTLLNTGAVIEAGSNLFGGVLAPKYVPPFSWGVGTNLVEYNFDKFVETATRAMGRRGIALDTTVIAMYRRLFDETRHLRQP